MTEGEAGAVPEEDADAKVIVSQGADHRDGGMESSGGDQNDMISSRAMGKEENGIAMAIDVKAETETGPAKSTATSRKEEQTGPTPAESRARLHRSSSKFASLRAAFERRSSDGSQDQGLALARFKSRSPGSRTFREQDGDAKHGNAELAGSKGRSWKEAELRKAVEERCAVLEDQNAELQARLQRKDHEWHAELARQRETLMEERNSALREVVDMQNKLLGLKRSISTSTRVENQVADSTFVLDMQKMYHEVQNWVVNNFRRVKLDKPGEQLCAQLESITGTKQLNYLKLVLQDFDPATPSYIKLSIFQAVIASYLMEIFDDALVFGLSSSQDWCKSIKEASEALSAVLPPEAYNKWRSTTLDVVNRGLDLKDSLDSASTSLSEMICITLSSLTDLEDASSLVPSLSAIVKRIVSLSHVFRVQLAQYDFHLPLPGVPFDPVSMDDDDPLSDSTITQKRTVRCAVFPSVTKSGNGSGDNPQLANIVVKAKVVCSDHSIPAMSAS